MSLHSRQKTDTLNVSRVALLCMATTLVVGFSTSENSGARLPSKAVNVTPSVLTRGQLLVADRTATRDRVQRPTAYTAQNTRQDAVIKVPATRTHSYAKTPSLDTVLGGVSSRRWLKSAQYSPDYARGHQQLRVPNQFHGIGFPDVRSHRTRLHKTSKPHSTSSWNRMISWRTPHENADQPEPIAYVRCMGLSANAVARRAQHYDALIVSLAVEFDVSASLIKAVITEESCFNNEALSPVGAQGLMQLMPETADWLKVRDPYDPSDNLRAGVRYLASLSQQFDTLELVLAAYNAGPGNVRRYNGVPPFAETRAYVRKVQAHYRRYVVATRLAAR